MKNNSNIGLALITGTAIGAAVSILFAPARGRDTRKKITRSAEDATDAIFRAGEKLKKNTKKKFMKEKSNLESRLDALTSQAYNNTEEYIPLLEKKLAELKKKGRKIVKKKIIAKV